MPVVPECGKRLVLATDTTISDTFRLLQHATTVEASSFSTMKMEVGTPRRMVLLLRHAHPYERVNCEQWTKIGEFGVLFHFNCNQGMVDAVL